MQSLYSVAGLERLDQLVRLGMLCAFDFDGTLAPIVTEPDAARMHPDILQRLVHLETLAPVAVITGRSLDDIRNRLGCSPSYVIGNHGLEGMDSDHELARDEEICRSWHAQLSRHLEQVSGPGAGILLEDKRYSLSLHYRATPDHAASAVWLGILAMQLEPAPRIVGGKCVINLLPPGVADKGHALCELLRRSGAAAAIYVGDDSTDESVFRVRRAELLTVRVECAADSAAAFCIPSHADIGRLLDELIVRLRRVGPQELQAGSEADAAGHELKLARRGRTDAA